MRYATAAAPVLPESTVVTELPVGVPSRPLLKLDAFQSLSPVFRRGRGGSGPRRPVVGDRFVSAETTCRFEELDRGVLAVTLRPELNEIPWTDIERIGSGIVGRVSSQAKPRVLVDLTELNHMGSAMVALVVRIWKATTEQNGQMIVVNRSDLVAEVLEISGLANKWTIVSSRDDALREFGAAQGFSSSSGESDRLGLALIALAVVLLIVGGLGIVDAAASGAVSGSLGRATTLWTATAISVVSLIAAAAAIVRTAGNLKLIAVVITTLAAVASVAGVGLALSRPAVRPAADTARPETPVRTNGVRAIAST